MKARHYFPLGKALGQAFCNRDLETKKLIGNLEHGKHTFMVAPRRYGKSSLCLKALTKSKLPWKQVDFHLAVTEKDVEKFIVNGVIDLIGESINHIDKLTQLISKTLKKLKPKFSLHAGLFHLELESESNNTPSENIADALLLLERLLKEKDQRAVLLFDEFQEVGSIAKGHGVEGAIRHAAQEMQHLSIIFSGSNPHMLQNMFEDDRRPLYNLCKKMVLQRISEEHYKKHLNIAAKLMWKQEISVEVFDRIMQLSERHPYYVNALCDEIWAECDDSPSIQDVESCWDSIVDGDRSELIKDFLSLSDNQRKVLMYLANFGGKSLFSSEAAMKMGVTNSSIPSAISTLLEKDYVEKLQGVFSIVVPTFRAILAT